MANYVIEINSTSPHASDIIQAHFEELQYELPDAEIEFVSD